MDWKKLFTPTIRNLLYFPTFFLLISFILWFFKLNIMPCTSALVTTGEPLWQEGFCNLNPADDLMIIWSSWTYVIVFSLLVFAPFILSCLVNYYLPEKKKQKAKKKQK